MKQSERATRSPTYRRVVALMSEEIISLFSLYGLLVKPREIKENTSWHHMDLILLNNHSKFCANKKDSVFSSIDIRLNTVTMERVYESRQHTYLNPNLFSA
jgi:hypothetical protein